MVLSSALIYLCAAVISVPIAKKLGLGSVLGYLTAGVLIGPFAFQLVGDQTEVMHFAELGVVMMLFLIGLELRPGLLWDMRKPILGLGGLQVLLTTAAISSAMLLLPNINGSVALAVGLALALSSTAIVVQSLTERDLMKTAAGNNAFAVLLFQDIAVIPILALLPLLVATELIAPNSVHSTNLLEGMPFWLHTVVIVGVIIGIIAIGHYVITPFFRFIATTHLQEIFTASALLIVLAITMLMQLIGLSPALGSFLAGVVLAENEFRHEIEVDIAPFKGLLLGLFFITVGASINFALLEDSPLLILGAVVALIAIKASVLGILAWIFKLGKSQGILFALALAQGGEFAFVLVATATQIGVFDLEIGSTITLVVALSMLVTPLLFVAYEYWNSRAKAHISEPEADINSIEPTHDVIIAGYGRFGQIIGRLLTAQGFHLSILDHSPSQIEIVRGFGNKAFYGDASRRDLLEAAGAAEAKLLIIAVDLPDKTRDIINTAREHFPHLVIMARAVDRRHAYELVRLKVASFRRETFDSALHLGVDALKALGVKSHTAERAGKLFDEHDHQSLEKLADIWGDDASYGVAVRQRLEDLTAVLQEDQETPTEDTTETERLNGVKN